MPKNRLLLFLLLLLFFIFPPIAKAQIVINEFSSAAGISSDPDWPDWVEIYYNNVDISLYQLIDSAENVKNLSEAVCTGDFCTIDWSNKLNNSSDTIKLVLISVPDLPVDQVVYGETGNICAPRSGQTIGRYPDGIGNFVKFSSPTKGAANTASQDLCPTPTPVPTSTPTPTPTPTLTPTKTPTPTPTKTPTPKPSPKEEIVLESQTSGSDQILGLRGQLKTSEPEEEEESPKKKFPVFPVILIILGAGLMGFAGYTLFKKMKSEGYNSESEENI